MDKFVKLDEPLIEEGSFLLRSYGLPRTRKLDSDVVIFHYCVDPGQRLSSDDQRSTSDDNIDSFEQSDEFLILEDRQRLYKPMIGEKAAIDPIYFPPPNKQSILVIDFVGCDIIAAKDFINATVSALQNSSTYQTPLATPSVQNHYPSTVFDAESLENHDHFITGISLRAADRPNKFLTLFVSIPYLGVGGSPTLDGSRTLSQYRLQNYSGSNFDGVDEKYQAPQILVHQIWFLVFDNETIGIFRSENDKYRNHAPLFPYQRRGGAFLALANMIFNTLTSSEKEALRILRRKIVQLEMSKDPEIYEGRETGEDKQPAKKHQFGDLITEVFTIMQLVRSQIESLENLLQVIKTGYRRQLQNRPQCNDFDIPFMHNHNEQISEVVRNISALVDDRQKFYKELAEELGYMKSLYQQESIATSLVEQGQAISVFTLITSVFLPLGFLSSYYGMNPPKFESVTIKTTSEFWLVSGPVTGFMLLLISFTLLKQNGGIKVWIRKKIGTRKDQSKEKKRQASFNVSQV